MRHEYWSCSTFADKIRGTKKLSAGTGEEWDKWEEDAKAAHPFRFWVAEEVLTFLQDVVYYIPDKIQDVNAYIYNRYIAKTHALTSSLTKGRYYEYDTRILHSLFDELVNFVEIEKAHMEYMCKSKDYSKKKHRNPEAGLAYLRWESSLLADYEDPDSGPSYQASAAQWVIRAYDWWTVTRPSRVDPMDASGWSAYCDLHHPIGKSDPEVTRPMLDQMYEIETRYEEEDTEMLVEYMKHRKYMWT